MPAKSFEPHSKPNKQPRRIISKLIVLILLISLGAGGWFYYQNNKRLNDTKKELKSSQEQQESLKKLNNDLSNSITNSVSAADYAAFTPECGESATNNLLLAKFNKEPIEKHNVYLYVCKDDLVTPRSLGDDGPLLRVAVTKINDIGALEFVYGASSIQPLCLREDIITDGVTPALSRGTGLDICT